MAALSANFEGFRPIQGSGLFSIEIGMNSALTFFRGTLGHVTVGTGKLIKANADGDDFWGVVEKPIVGTAADQLVVTWARGIFWFTGVSAFTHANNAKLMAATAASDNPADLTPQTTGTCGAAGRLIGIEVTAVSGYLDISDRSAAANA